jgi:TolA-binding protein
MSVEYGWIFFSKGENHTNKFLLKTVKNIPICFVLLVVLFIANLYGIAAAGNLYTIHCASYKTSKKAAEDVKKLAAMGYAAFSMQVEIKHKGKWYRVYTGKYETREQAKLAAEDMVKKKAVSEYFIFPVAANLAAQNKEKNIKKANALTDKPVVIIASRDSKRYHLPGMPFYNKVKQHHHVVFNSEKEAIAAGYCKAGESITQSVKDKQAAAPAVEKQPEKSSLSQVKQGKQWKQSRQTIVRKDAVAAEIKTAQKVQHVPSPLVFDKNPGRVQNGEQASLEKEEDNSGSPLYDKALKELKAKNYDQALVTFKEFVARADTSKVLGERALRHMADCHFFLGEKGGKDHLPVAVQFYKNTLQSFPDQSRDNTLVYLRLAKSYEYLNNYFDALKNYENLLSKYPRSAYVPEAFFKSGALLHKMGKYSQAADKLIAYLMKYRGGAFAKQAFYLVADCYYKMQQSASAEVWFRDAQKKWPHFTGIPKEVIKDMGQHKFSMRSYIEASKIFSFYANVYTNDEKIKEVLFALANSYKAADQVSAALTVYNFIIDKYPESKEANESIVAMASLGIDRPGSKMFFVVGNFHYYKDPLEACNLLLMKNQTGEIAQNALLQKGNALHKLKQDRKAADIYLEFLKKYPQSKITDEVKKGLKLASGALIDCSYEKKDYLAVADIYFKAYRAVPLQPDEYEIVDKIAVSLSNIGLSDDCFNLLKNYRNVCKDNKIAGKIMVRIAEADRKRLSDKAIVDSDYNKSLNQSSSQELKSWSLFQMGQDYQKTGNYAEAQKTFTKIKTESGPEGFWTKIVDYYVNEQQWWDKYGEYLKR